jgi:hypothetical protein
VVQVNDLKGNLVTLNSIIKGGKTISITKIDSLTTSKIYWEWPNHILTIENDLIAHM